MLSRISKKFSNLLGRGHPQETSCEPKQEIESVQPKLDNLLLLLKDSTDYSSPDVGEALRSLADIPFELDRENPHKTDEVSSPVFSTSVFAHHCRNVARYLLEAGYVQLFVAIANSLKHNVCGGSRYDQKGWENFGLLCWGMINYAEFTPEIGQQLAQCGGIPVLFQALAFLEKDVTRQITNISPYNMKLLILFIVYHCRHDNHRIYRRANAVQIMSKYLESEDLIRKTYALLTLACIDNNDKEGEILKAKDCVGFLMDLLEEGVESTDHTAVFKDDEGFPVAVTVKDMLDGLAHLAVNDDNKTEIDKLGGTSLMNHILESEFTDDEKEHAIEVLHGFLFVEDIRKNVNFGKAKDSLKKHRKSQHQAVRRASISALWELEGNKLPQAVDVQPATLSQSTNVSHPHPGHVMLSYQWNSQKLVGRIKKKLDRAGYDVWMDVDKMRGDMLEAMALAVERSEVVILCMSEKYKKSNNCRSEATYAYKRKKRVIPLLVEDGYDPDGWLGLLVGMQMYYRFCTEEEFKANIPKLIDAIGTSGLGGD